MIVCSVRAFRTKDVGEIISGKLSILNVTNVNFVLYYEDSFGTTIGDLEDCEFNEESCMSVQFNDLHLEKIVRLHVVDRLEFDLFTEAVRECKSVCQLTLRLQTLSRDIYYAGIYSSIDKDKDFILRDELEMILSQNGEDLTNSFDFFSLPIEDKVDLIGLEDSTLSYEQSPENHDISQLVCVYCEVAMTTDPDRDFMIHPFVPRNFQNEFIYMCMICVNNWKEFRDQAESDNQLILTDEINEELCALCSDTPKELILCSSCPRSYCHQCLDRILLKDQLDKLYRDSDTEWTCMCCTMNVMLHIPLPSNSWRVIKANNLNSSVLDYQKLAKLSNKSKSDDFMDSKTLAFIEDKTAHETESGISIQKLTRKKSSDHDDENKKSAPKKKSKLSPAKDSSPPSVILLRGNQLPDEPNLPPVDPELDEVYYFSQYVQYYASTCMDGSCNQMATDDVCFLCKDGGELIECDWNVSSKKKHCRKVYHEYCLAYNVNEGDEWNCPRHYCDMCFSTQLKYICRYCPVSICEKCPEEMVKKYGIARYAILDTPNNGEFPPHVTVIACQSCLDMLEKCQSRSEYADSMSHLLKDFSSENIHRFPGTHGRTEADSSKRGGRKIDLCASRKAGPAANEISKDKEKDRDRRRGPKSSSGIWPTNSSNSYNRFHPSNNVVGSAKWSREDIEILQSAGKRYGLNVDAILNDPDFAAKLGSKTAAAICTKLTRYGFKDACSMSDNEISCDQDIGKIPSNIGTDSTDSVMSQSASANSFPCPQISTNYRQVNYPSADPVEEETKCNFAKELKKFSNSSPMCDSDLRISDIDENLSKNVVVTEGHDRHEILSYSNDCMVEPVVKCKGEGKGEIVVKSSKPIKTNSNSVSREVKALEGRNSSFAERPRTSNTRSATTVRAKIK